MNSSAVDIIRIPADFFSMPKEKKHFSTGFTAEHLSKQAPGWV